MTSGVFHILQPSLYSFSFIKGVLIPLFLLIIFTPFSAALDLKSSSFFFHVGTFPSNPFWNWLYVYGTWPAWIMVGCSLVGLIASYAKKSLASWRIPCIYLLLVYAVGAGLFVHAIFKDHWGRPRPKQTIEFGGTQPFRAYYQPHFMNAAEPSKSFPCGHASTGFYFFALGLLGAIGRSRLIYWVGMCMSWGLGTLLSIARIAQGGHFLSDTVAAALIMWLTAWFLAYLMFPRGGWNEGIDKQTT